MGRDPFKRNRFHKTKQQSRGRHSCLSASRHALSLFPAGVLDVATTMMAESELPACCAQAQSQIARHQLCCAQAPTSHLHHCFQHQATQTAQGLTRFPLQSRYNLRAAFAIEDFFLPKKNLHQFHRTRTSAAQHLRRRGVRAMATRAVRRAVRSRKPTRCAWAARSS